MFWCIIIFQRFTKVFGDIIQKCVSYSVQHCDSCWKQQCIKEQELLAPQINFYQENCVFIYNSLLKKGDVEAGKRQVNWESVKTERQSLVPHSENIYKSSEKWTNTVYSMTEEFSIARA